MKKLISVLLSTATVFSLALLPVSATSIPEVENACDSSRYWTNEGSLSQQFLCHFYGEIAHRAGLCEAVGDWDLEPIRPNTGLFQFAINKCNPHD